MDLFYDLVPYSLQSTFALKHILTFTIVTMALYLIRKPRGLTG